MQLGVYSIRRKDDSSFIAYMRGVRLSKDGDSWYLPRPDEFKDLCELEKSGLIFFEENKEIPDDSTSFSELLGIDLLSLKMLLAMPDFMWRGQKGLTKSNANTIMSCIA